jgi:RimJ/RimL family protein N-acetyltransferase
MIHYGFRSLDLNKIYLDVAKNNRAAIALYQKSGFSTEGIFKEHCFIQGKYRDVLRMSLLRKNYQLKDFRHSEEPVRARKNLKARHVYEPPSGT